MEDENKIDPTEVTQTLSPKSASQLEDLIKSQWMSIGEIWHVARWEELRDEKNEVKYMGWDVISAFANVTIATAFALKIWNEEKKIAEEEKRQPAKIAMFSRNQYASEIVLKLLEDAKEIFVFDSETEEEKKQERRRVSK